MKRIFLLAIVLLLTGWGIYQWLLPNWLPATGPIQLIPMDTSRVSRLVIKPSSPATGIYSFSREEKGWFATDQRITRMAPHQMVDAMLTSLGGIQTQRLTPVDPGKLLLDVQSERTVEFIVYEEGEQSDQFTVQRLITLEEKDTSFLLRFPNQSETYLLPQFDFQGAWPGFVQIHDPRLWPSRKRADFSGVRWWTDTLNSSSIVLDNSNYLSNKGDTLDHQRTEDLFDYLFERKKECLAAPITKGFTPYQELRMYFGEKHNDSISLQLLLDTAENTGWLLTSTDRPGNYFRIDSTEFYTEFIDPLQRLFTYQPEPDTLLIAR